MNILNRLNNFLFTSKFEYFYVFIMLLSMIINGVWYTSGIPRILMISKDIFSNPFLEQVTSQWLLGSFLGPILGYIFHMNQSFFSFCIMHLVIFLLFFYFLLKSVDKHYKNSARYILIAFFVMPVSNIAFTWLGYADVFTILLGSGLVIYRKNLIIIFILGILFGLNHFEQGLVILLTLSIFYFLTENKLEIFKYSLIMLLGILLGYISLKLHFYIYNFNISFDRVSYIDNAGFYKYFATLFSNFFAEIFSYFNIFIFPLILMLNSLEKRNKNVSNGFIIGVVIIFFITIFTVDHTRVFNMVVFPLLIALFLNEEVQKIINLKEKRFNLIITFVFLIGIFIPNYYIWQGKIYASSWPFIFEYLKN